MFQLTDILQKAKITGYEKPKQNKNQSKYKQMIVMQWENVKLIVGRSMKCYTFSRNHILNKVFIYYMRFSGEFSGMEGCSIHENSPFLYYISLHTLSKKPPLNNCKTMQQQRL